jgi:hypothetical protein
MSNPSRVYADPQWTHVIEEVQVSNSLSAVVVDPDDSPREGIVVEEMTADWSRVLRTTKTDASGTFRLEPVKGRKVYFIRISDPVMQRTEFRMRVDKKHGKPIKIQMEFAT